MIDSDKRDKPQWFSIDELAFLLIFVSRTWVPGTSSR